MAYKTKKTEGGHKKGHSNMAHWTHTEEIKADTKKVRRQTDRKELIRGLAECIGRIIIGDQR